MKKIESFQDINGRVIILKGIEKPHFFETTRYSLIEFGTNPFSKKIAIIVSMCYKNLICIFRWRPFLSAQFIILASE